MEASEQLDELVPLLRRVLVVLGEDPERDGLRETPERWARALLTYTQGNRQDPEEHLKTIFQLDEEDYSLESDDMILQDSIEFTSMCEHHLAPFRGLVHVAYIPNPETRTITGLSKIPRVVDVYARRLQVQERMTQRIAGALDTYLVPLGVIVVVQGVHYCMVQRGVEQRSSSTTTTARRGVFLHKPELEQRFQAYLQLQLDSSRVW